MKQNELQDFNNLPDEWAITTLGKVLPILYGKGLTKDKRDEEGPYPVFGSSGQVGKHSESLTKKPTIIIGRKGSVGEVYYSLVPCWPIDTTYYVEETENLYLRFFEYLLKGLNLGKLDKSTAVPGLSRDDYNVVQVAIAPLDQQKFIVAEIEKQFSRLDEAVAALKRIQANLKRYKASVLKAAVEGKLTEQWRKEHPDVEPASELLKRILAERRKKWEEKNPGKKYKEPVAPDTSNLPELPKGWTWAMTDQLFFFVTSGSRGWAKYYSDDGPIFLRIGNLDHGTIKLDLTDIQRVKPPQNTEGSRTLVVARDILISITADVGMIGVIPSAFEEAYINQHISLTRPVPSINSLYLAWFLSCKTGQDQFQSQQRGATKLGLGLDDIKSVIVPLPPSEEQNLIVQEIERLFSCAEKIESIIELNINRTDRLRQAILKKAFLGRFAK